MSSGYSTDVLATSEEVAEDYKSSLEFLITNDRYSINNLTVIAKENIEHAEAICRVIDEHIRNAPPTRKLPALYVVDSIAKNIGTPYNLFLGSRLYNIFMGAYTLVDPQTRKKLDEMLRTWKGPVPGSRDPRPVFEPSVTKRIETALIQARTLAVQQQEQQRRSQHELLRRRAPSTTPSAPYRNTPTPPQNSLHYLPPSSQGYTQPQHVSGNGQIDSPHPIYINQSSLPPPRVQYAQPVHVSNNHANQSQYLPNPEYLHKDVENLIFRERNEFANNPYDESIQTRLTALLQLQVALKTQQLSPDQLQAVHDQVYQLKNPVQQPALTPAPPRALVGAPPPVKTTYHSQPTVPALPSAANLADLLAAAAARSQQVTPPVPQISYVPAQPPQITISQARPIPAPAPAPVESTFLASLRASGLLALAGTPPTNGFSSTTRPPLPFVPSPTHVVSTPPVQLASLVQRPPPPTSQNDVMLTSASLKIPRRYLISKLYEARPNQCSTCGKRFLATDEGKSKKARHLDWHFRTNLRLAEAAKRGQSRSWYVDEMEWIRSRENIEEGIDRASTGRKDTKALAAAAAAAKNDPKTKFIPAPSEDPLASLPCPICQEKFQPSWNDDLQDFVWMDAVKIGNRVYHASCYSELKKDGGNTPLRTGTPDSVLGKRKAEATASNPSPAKLKRDSLG